MRKIFLLELEVWIFNFLWVLWNQQKWWRQLTLWMKNHLDNYLPSMSLAGLAASRVGIPTGSQWLGTVPRNYEGFRKCLLKISELSLEQWALIFFSPGFLWESRSKLWRCPQKSWCVYKMLHVISGSLRTSMKFTSGAGLWTTYHLRACVLG